MGRRRIPADAFETYFAQGPGRSYEALAAKYGVTKQAVLKCAQREDWQQRLRRREADARARAEQSAAESLDAINQRHLKAVRAIQGKAIEALRASPLKTAMEAVRALDLAIKQERLIIGEPTDRSALTIEDLIRREYDRWITVEEATTDTNSKSGGEGDVEAPAG